MLSVGSTAPDFELQDQDGEVVALGGHEGRTLLYWYPKADTPGCAAQAQSLRDQAEVFDELGCRILGASFDPIDDLHAFARKFALEFPLLSDTSREVGRRYEVAGADGDSAYAARIAYLIGADGRVEATYEVDNPELFAERVLDDLEEMER